MPDMRSDVYDYQVLDSDFRARYPIVNHRVSLLSEVTSNGHDEVDLLRAVVVRDDLKGGTRCIRRKASGVELQQDLVSGLVLRPNRF